MNLVSLAPRPRGESSPSSHQLGAIVMRSACRRCRSSGGRRRCHVGRPRTLAQAQLIRRARLQVFPGIANGIGARHGDCGAPHRRTPTSSWRRAEGQMPSWSGELRSEGMFSKFQMLSVRRNAGTSAPRVGVGEDLTDKHHEVPFLYLVAPPSSRDDTCEFSCARASKTSFG